MLDSTLIVWMGEFGRTPEDQRVRRPRPLPQRLVDRARRRRDQAAARRSATPGADGEQVKDRPVSVPDLLATVMKGLGIDPAKQNTVENGRPIRLVDPKAKPIKELLG